MYTLISLAAELHLVRSYVSSSTTSHKCKPKRVWTHGIARVCHITANCMTCTNCDCTQLCWNWRIAIEEYRRRGTRAAESPGCTLCVHAPIDSLNNASHDAASHLAAPFIADRTNASIAADVTMRCVWYNAKAWQGSRACDHPFTNEPHGSVNMHAHVQ